MDIISEYSERVKKIYRNYVVWTVLDLFIISLSFLLMVLFLSALFDLPVILFSTVGILLLIFIKKPLNVEKLFLYIEKKHPAFKDRFLTPYQIFKKENVSKDILTKLLKEYIPWLLRIPRFWIRLTALHAFLFLILSIFFFYFYSTLHMDQYFTSLFSSRGIEIRVVPLKSSVQEGDTLRIKISVNSSYHFRYINLYREDENKNYRLRLHNNQVVHGEIFTKDTRIFLHLHRVKAGPYLYKVVKKQGFRHFQWIAQSRYTHKTRIFRGREVRVYPDERLEFFGITIKPCDSASVFLKNKLLTRTSVRKDTLKFTLNELSPGLLRVSLYNDNSEKCEKFNISFYNDNIPMVEIYYPAMDMTIPLSMKLLVKGYFIDDRGVNSVYFVISKGDSIRERRRIYSKVSKEDSVIYLWNLEDEDLTIGEEVTYWLEAIDIGGGKGVSKKYKLRFPGMDEIYSEFSYTSGKVEEKLEYIKQKSKIESDELRKISEKLAKTKELSPEDFEKVKEILNQQKQSFREMERTLNMIEQARERMEQGILYDRETMNKIEELKKLMEETFPESLRRTLDTLKISPDLSSMREMLEELLFQQDKLKKRLERAIDVLKMMQQIEKIEELSRRIKDLMDKQEQALEDLDRKDINSFIEKEKDIEENVKDMKSDSLSSLIYKNLSEMESYLQNAISSTNSEMMKKWGEKTLKSMRDTWKALNDYLASFKKKRDEENFENLKKVSQDLFFLNKEIEELKNEDNPRKMEEVKRALKDMGDSLYSISRSMNDFNPVVYENIYEAMRNIEEAEIGSMRGELPLKQKKILGALKNVRKVMYQLSQMMQSMKEGSSCPNPQWSSNMPTPGMIGMMQMELMQEMANLPLPLPMNMSEALSQKAQELMERQRMLREMLEQYINSNEDAGFSTLLKQIVEEMKKVEEEIYKKNIDRKLIERQRGIVSRLLEAERSIRERGSKGYYREVGKNDWNNIFSGKLPENLGDRKRKIRMIIYRELQKEMPEEFETYIKLYLESLLEE